jgi:translation initiation factor eIF-2B subunit delta
VAAELITEAQIPRALQGADLALIGADAFLGDGSAVSKVGSRLLALAARDQGVPFFVLADTIKLAPWLPEEVPPGVWETGRSEDVWDQAPAGVQIRNATFETVPASLITKYITEEGIREPEQMGAFARSATKLWTDLGAF